MYVSAKLLFFKSNVLVILYMTLSVNVLFKHCIDKITVMNTIIMFYCHTTIMTLYVIVARP